MKRFQLCLLAVCMLLVSNCVAGSDTVQLTGAQSETPLGTGESLTGKELTTKTDDEKGVQKAKGEKTDETGSTKQLAPQGEAHKLEPGASGPETNVKKDTQTEGNPSHGAPVLGGDGKDQKKEGLTPQSAPAAEDTKTKTQTGGKPSQGDPVVGGAAKDQTKGESPQKDAPATENTNTDPKAKDDTSKSAPATKDGASDPKTGGKPSEGAPATEGDTKETKAKDDHSKSAPAAEDDKTKTETGGKPSEGAPVVAGTTAAPAAEGKPTEGNSGSASTSTHIPTDPAKGADSQASVKAGVLSFILSIGSVLAVFA